MPRASVRGDDFATIACMAQPVSLHDAQALLEHWVTSPSLRRHCQAVSAAMTAHAERDDHDVELWAVTGLLHDADYERFPDVHDPEHGHPRTIMAELERRDAPPEMVRAIAAHADVLDVPAESAMERTLVAVDELCGFIVAVAKVRPEGIHGLKPKSVKKKLGQPSFAAAVSREDVRGGAELLGVDFDALVAFVIAALQARADALELNGSAAHAEG